jgi:WD40 repeat protein
MTMSRAIVAATVTAIAVCTFSSCSQKPDQKQPAPTVLKGTLKTTLAGGDMESLRAVAFSPDSKLLLSGSLGFVVKLWDAQTGAEKNKFKDVSPPIAFSAGPARTPH